MRRTPAQVIGDGRSTVADLFRQLGVSRGYDPILRNFSNADVKDLQVVDVLERQGLNPDHIPERGRRVMLRGNANVSTGGSVEDVTAQVHRDNLKLAERAAAAIGIDYAGIDFISPDITRSWLDVGGGICEVNPTPGKLHLEAVDWVLDYLFTKGDAGRIPIIVVVGDAPQSRYMHSRIVNGMGSLGHVVGEVMDGVAHVNGSRISHPAAFHRSPIPLMLADPGVTLAVMHVTPATIVRDGLDIDRCSLALLWVDDDEATKLLGLPLAAFSRADRLLMRPGDDEVMAALTY